MRVAIDLSSAAYGGGITYARELLPRLLEYPTVDVGPVLVRPNLVEVLPPTLQIVPARSRLAARDPRWRSAAESCDVVFAPTEITFQRYDVPLVLAIRNASLALSLVRESSLRRKARFLTQRQLARRSAKWASAHIAVSGFAARLGENLGVSPQRLRVVYHGGPAPVRAVETRPARRFLFVSALYRYKNVDRMINAFAGLPGNWTLDIVGADVDRRFRRLLDDLTRRLNLEDRVHFRGHLSGDALRSAYLNADCFVWPPYAETFGHPLLEAHSFGLPILAARAASSQEIVGDAAVYFDPYSVADLRNQLSYAAQVGVQAGPLPRQYSWEKCAAATAAVFQSVTSACD